MFNDCFVSSSCTVFQSSMNSYPAFVKMTPKVSVIIPVYNVECYLARCLDSVLAQTYTDFELILVDDGSTDASPAICDSYARKDERVRVFHQENKGVSAARNLGIEESRGEFISFIDSDDWVEPDYCETLVNGIQDSDVCFVGMKWHYGDGSVVTYLQAPFRVEGKLAVEQAIVDMHVNSQQMNYFGYTWNKVFKGDVIRGFNVRFPLALRVHEDEVFAYEYCLHIRSLRVLDKEIYHYRILDSGLTHRPKSALQWKLYADSLWNILSHIELAALRTYIRECIGGVKVNEALGSRGLEKTASVFGLLKYCVANKNCRLLLRYAKEQLKLVLS